MTHQTLMTDQTRSNRLNDKVIGGKQKPSQVVFFLGVGGGGVIRLWKLMQSPSNILLGHIPLPGGPCDCANAEECSCEYK